MAFLSLLSILAAGLMLFIIGLFLLVLYLCVFVLLPGYIIYGLIKLIMLIVEKCKGNVQHREQVQSKLNLSFLEQKYKQMINEEISIDAFNKYLKNEIHIHYADNYEYCQHIFEAKMDMVGKNETPKTSRWVPYVVIISLAMLLIFNLFGPKMTLLFAAIGVFLFYLSYTLSSKNKEGDSAIRYSMYKHIAKFCSDKIRPIVVEIDKEIDVEAAIADAVEQVTAKSIDKQTEPDMTDVPVQLEMEIVEMHSEDEANNEI